MSDDDPFSNPSPPTTQRRRRKLVARYDYVDENGAPLFQVRRFEPGRHKPKDFSQHKWMGDHWLGDGMLPTGKKEEAGLDGLEPVLFRLPAVIEAVAKGEPVWVVEGEKDVLTLERSKLGLVATTHPGGAAPGKWKPSFSETLRGADVKLVTDWDPPSKTKNFVGQRHAIAVAQSLEGVARSVQIFRPAVGCKDVTDHLEAGHDLDGLLPKTVKDLQAHIAVNGGTSVSVQAGPDARRDDEKGQGVPRGLIVALGFLTANGYGPDRMPDDMTKDVSIRCPVHDDRNPSATLRAGKDRPVLFKCHAGCTQEAFYDWLRSVGMSNAELMDTNGPSSETLGRIWTPGELAERTIESPKWLIQGLLIEDTFGVLAGERKSLKSYLSTTMAIAVASGKPYLDEFPVHKSGPVLIFAGEGGEAPFIRRVRKICDAMGVPWQDGPHVVFDSMRFGSDQFKGTLAKALDEIQPVYVVIDPLYVYHDPSVSPANLYERGAMLREVESQIVRGGASFTLVDHFNKTGSGSGLDRVSMSGTQEWSDTWMLASHRETPDIQNGEFFLKLEIGSRQWGGREFGVDYTVGPFNEDLMVHDGELDWSVVPLEDKEAIKRNDKNLALISKRQEARRKLIEFVRKRPGLAPRVIIRDGYIEIGTSQKEVGELITELIQGGELYQVENQKRTGMLVYISPPLAGETH